MSSLVVSTGMMSLAGVFAMLFCLRKQIPECPHSLERMVGDTDVVGMFSGAG